MSILEITQASAAFLSMSIIVYGSLRLKKYLKSMMCFL